MWKASADRFTWHSRGKRRQWVFFHWSYQVPFKHTWGFLWSWLLSNSEHSFSSWWKACLYGAAFWEIPHLEYPASYLGTGIFLSEAYLCKHGDVVLVKSQECAHWYFEEHSGLAQFDATFSRDSKRHLSYTRLSPCQISHPCSKAWRRASFLANYLQALITWPKQIILPHLIFWGSQIFLFELSKAKGISCGQTHDMDIFSSNSLSLAKLQTIDSSPGREVPDEPSARQGFQLHL